MTFLLGRRRRALWRLLARGVKLPAKEETDGRTEEWTNIYIVLLFLGIANETCDIFK